MKNTTGSHPSPLTDVHKLSLVMVYSLTITVALLGNIFIIRIVTKTRRLKTSTNIMLVQLAIADLLVTILVMPMVLSQIFGGFPFWFRGIVGKITCKMVHFPSHITIASSIITLMLMATERFFAVIFPLRRVSYFKSKTAVTCTIWGGSMVIMLPVLIAGNTIKERENYVCIRQWETLGDANDVKRVFYISMFVLLYALPLLLMAVLYSIICHKLWFRQLPGSVISNNEKLAQIEKRCVVRMLIAIVVVFALCWLPAHLSHFAFIFPNEKFSVKSPVWLDYVKFWISHANSAFNPCLYITLNKKFQRAFVKLFKRRKFNGNNLPSTFFRSLNLSLTRSSASNRLLYRRRTQYHVRGTVLVSSSQSSKGCFRVHSL